MNPLNYQVSLPQFEGPIDFLLHLIQKNEIPIDEVTLCSITKRYLETLEEKCNLDEGAELIGNMASLILLKSRHLLPRHDQANDFVIEEEDPRFEVIHHLIDYCRFKQAAKSLAEREQQQSAHYLRTGDEEGTGAIPIGVDHLSLEDLAQLFQQALNKSASRTGVVYEEEWRVADKMKEIRELLKEIGKVLFDEVFSPEKSRGELIATFLAILELMKMEVIKVARDRETESIVVILNLI